MEVLHKEQAYEENVLKKDPNLSTLDDLVHLVAKTTIQLKALEIALDNWDATLKIIMEVNKTFLEKYSITPQEPFDISVKKGQNKSKGEIIYSFLGENKPKGGEFFEF